MTPPRVSVILPTWNRATLLPRAIASVLGQSFTGFELIVVDDGSTDDTPAVVARLADARVRYLRSERNVGDAGARNLGAATATGDWLAFMDSDDEWLPDALERQLRFADQRPGALIVGASSIRIGRERVDIHVWPTRDDGAVDVAKWMVERIANLQAMLVRRAAFTSYGGFDTGFRATADADFTFRMLEREPERVAARDELVAVMHETDGSLIGNPQHTVADLRRMASRHAPMLAAHPNAKASLIYLLALSELRCGRIAESRRCAVETIRARPTYWRPWAFLCASMLGARTLNALRASSRNLQRHLIAP